MRSAARHILAFFLVIALIVGGVPFAHAMPSPVPVHDQHMYGHDDAHAAHHEMQHAAAHDIQHDTAPGKTANDLCKGLKCCSMCATAYVEPVLRTMTIDRVSFAVRYDAPVAAHPQTISFLDPGIPIV